MNHYFINTYSEELNLKLIDLGLFNSSFKQGGYTTTTVVIPKEDDSFKASFFNGYGKPTYKNKDKSSAVLELNTIEEFLEIIKNNI